MAQSARPQLQTDAKDLTGDTAFARPDQPFPTGRGILSAAEIEALLRPDLPDDPPPAPPQEITPVQTPPLETQTEPPTMAQAGALAARLSYILRAECDLDARLKATKCRDVNLPSMRFAEGGAICLFADLDGNIEAALALAASLVRTIAHSVTGADRIVEDPSALTPLELAVTFRILEPLAQALGEDISLVRIETNGIDARALLAPGQALEAELDMHVRGQDGPAFLARRQHHTDHAQTSAHSMADQAACPSPGGTGVPKAGHLTTLVTARIASLRVPVSRLANLKPGATLLLGVPSDQPVTLLSGSHQGVPIGEGRIGRHGNQIAIKLTARKPLG